MYLDSSGQQPYDSHEQDMYVDMAAAADVMMGSGGDVMMTYDDDTDAYEEVISRQQQQQQQQGCVNNGCDTPTHMVMLYPYSDYPSPEGDGSLV